MKLRIASDLHLEFSNKFRFPNLPDDNETILVLAGDICVVDSLNQVKEFFEDCCKQFKQVLYVFGNHEYYHGSLTRAVNKFKEKIKYDNLFVTDCGNYIINNYNFILATLWTDFNKSDFFAMTEANNKMNDFNLIRLGRKDDHYKFKLKPVDTIVTHQNHLRFIKDTIYLHDDKINIVVSHHLPSFKSVDIDRYGRNSLNHAYYSDLDNFIVENKPKLWIHGHTHDSFEYNILDTHVICNPKGYTQRVSKDGIETEIWQNKLFDSTLLLEL